MTPRNHEYNQIEIQLFIIILSYEHLTVVGHNEQLYLNQIAINIIDIDLQI